ncbi:MAG TPA: ABC transporter substrate-binding protein [Rhizomicrobium sp.]|nr:ABC transporter substrate-binding protein [Rhizomicrobium sp.]
MKRFVARLARLDTALSLALAVTFSVFLFTAARAATPAETFVQTNVQAGMGILSNNGLSKAQRATQFRAFLLTLTDLKRIALYTLGPARRTATPAEQDAFVDAFKDYAFAVYETEFSKYSGQSLKVTGSIQRSNGDYVVTTVLVDPNAPRNQEPIEVDFRVFGTEGHYFVADITVAGLDLAITEQDQFNAYLAQNGNSIKSLIADLHQRAQKVRETGQLG